jgi:hypothetical protein
MVDSAKYKPKHTNLLYVDGLNYGNRFFVRNGNFWDIARAERKIKKFVEAANKS